MRRQRDAEFMRRAIALAGLGPSVDVNPRVGAVIVGTDGMILGEGYHLGVGTPHAEVNALRQAGAAAQGATAYVSLEPCNHTGRTGPCAQALLAAGIARVVYAQADPNPAASGGGSTLRRAGVDVTGGVLAPEAAALNPAWTFAVTHRRPLVTWKFAATLDGYSAAADGNSAWITSPEARADVHELRVGCDAILVGTGTVLADDPHLTVRYPDGTLRDQQPLRVVAGRREIPAGCRVLDDAAETLRLPTRDPHDILAALHHREIRHVWLEGGPTLAAAFLQAGLVDEVIGYLAPALLGAGRAAVGDLGIATMADIMRLRITQIRAIGPDVRLTCRSLAADDKPADQPGRVRQEVS